jgi:hypothetical protein
MECLLVAWADNVVTRCEDALNLIDNVNKRVKEADPNILYEADIISRVAKSIKQEIVEHWGRLAKLDLQEYEFRPKNDIAFDIFKDARIVKDCLRNISDNGANLMTPDERTKLSEISAKLEFLGEQIQFLYNVLCELMAVNLVYISSSFSLLIADEPMLVVVELPREERALIRKYPYSLVR